MKTIIHFFQFAIISVLFVFSACSNSSKKKGADISALNTEQVQTSNQQKNGNNMHSKHNSLANNFAHSNIVLLKTKANIDETTTNKLEQVVGAYLQIKDALFAEDETTADKAIVLMEERVNAVSPNKLSGEGLSAWQNHKELYETKLKEMLHIKGLENKRSYFSHISEIMYCTVKSFGLQQGKLFAIYCPMAFDNKGAYWLSNNKEIQNPYMGKKMPACGEIKEEL